MTVKFSDLKTVSDTFFFFLIMFSMFSVSKTPQSIKYNCGQLSEDEVECGKKLPFVSCKSC